MYIPVRKERLAQSRIPSRLPFSQKRSTNSIISPSNEEIRTTNSPLSHKEAFGPMANQKLAKKNQPSNYHLDDRIPIISYSSQTKSHSKTQPNISIGPFTSIPVLSPLIFTSPTRSSPPQQNSPSVHDLDDELDHMIPERISSVIHNNSYAALLNQEYVATPDCSSSENSDNQSCKSSLVNKINTNQEKTTPSIPPLGNYHPLNILQFSPIASPRTVTSVESLSSDVLRSPDAMSTTEHLYIPIGEIISQGSDMSHEEQVDEVEGIDSNEAKEDEEEDIVDDSKTGKKHIEKDMHSLTVSDSEDDDIEDTWMNDVEDFNDKAHQRASNRSSEISVGTLRSFGFVQDRALQGAQTPLHSPMGSRMEKSFCSSSSSSSGDEDLESDKKDQDAYSVYTDEFSAASDDEGFMKINNYSCRHFAGDPTIDEDDNIHLSRQKPKRREADGLVFSSRELKADEKPIAIEGTPEKEGLKMNEAKKEEGALRPLCVLPLTREELWNLRDGRSSDTLSFCLSVTSHRSAYNRMQDVDDTESLDSLFLTDPFTEDPFIASFKSFVNLRETKRKDEFDLSKKGEHKEECRETDEMFEIIERGDSSQPLTNTGSNSEEHRDNVLVKEIDSSTAPLYQALKSSPALRERPQDNVFITDNWIDSDFKGSILLQSTAYDNPNEEDNSALEYIRRVLETDQQQTSSLSSDTRRMHDHKTIVQDTDGYLSVRSQQHNILSYFADDLKLHDLGDEEPLQEKIGEIGSCYISSNDIAGEFELRRGDQWEERDSLHRTSYDQWQSDMEFYAQCETNRFSPNTVFSPITPDSPIDNPFSTGLRRREESRETMDAIERAYIQAADEMMAPSTHMHSPRSPLLNREEENEKDDVIKSPAQHISELKADIFSLEKEEFEDTPLVLDQREENEEELAEVKEIIPMKECPQSLVDNDLSETLERETDLSISNVAMKVQYQLENVMSSLALKSGHFDLDNGKKVGSIIKNIHLKRHFSYGGEQSCASPVSPYTAGIRRDTVDTECTSQAPNSWRRSFSDPNNANQSECCTSDLLSSQMNCSMLQNSILEETSPDQKRSDFTSGTRKENNNCLLDVQQEFASVESGSQFPLSRQTQEEEELNDSFGNGVNLEAGFERNFRNLSFSCLIKDIDCPSITPTPVTQLTQIAGINIERKGLKIVSLARQEDYNDSVNAMRKDEEVKYKNLFGEASEGNRVNTFTSSAEEKKSMQPLAGVRERKGIVKNIGARRVDAVPRQYRVEDSVVSTPPNHQSIRKAGTVASLTVPVTPVVVKKATFVPRVATLASKKSVVALQPRVESAPVTKSDHMGPVRRPTHSREEHSRAEIASKELQVQKERREGTQLEKKIQNSRTKLENRAREQQARQQTRLQEEKARQEAKERVEAIRRETRARIAMAKMETNKLDKSCAQYYSSSAKGELQVNEKNTVPLLSLSSLSKPLLATTPPLDLLSLSLKEKNQVISPNGSSKLNITKAVISTVIEKRKNALSSREGQNEVQGKGVSYCKQKEMDKLRGNELKPSPTKIRASGNPLGTTLLERHTAPKSSTLLNKRHECNKGIVQGETGIGRATLSSDTSLIKEGKACGEAISSHTRSSGPGRDARYCTILPPPKINNAKEAYSETGISNFVDNMEEWIDAFPY